MVYLKGLGVDYLISRGESGRKLKNKICASRKTERKTQGYHKEKERGKSNYNTAANDYKKKLFQANHSSTLTTLTQPAVQYPANGSSLKMFTALNGPHTGREND